MMRLNDAQKKISRFPSILILLLAFSILLPAFSNAQAGWTPDTRLTFRQGIGYYPRAACNGDTIHLVWWQAYISHNEIFYKRSTDAGMTWGNDTIISKEDTISGDLPSIAVSGNNIHVVWREQHVYYNGICYRRSTDGGNSWCNIDTIMKAALFGFSDPWICVNKDQVYVVAFRGTSTSELMLCKSTDNGNAWTDTMPVVSGGWVPRIVNPADDSLLLFVVYLDSNVEISTIHSTDGGISWSGSQIISDHDTIASQQPALTIDDNYMVHVTWYDYKYSPYSWTGDIFYRSSVDTGATWQPIESLTVYHRAVNSDILASGNTLHLVWDDERNDPGYNFEIYYRLSTDLGQSWLSEIRLTNADSNSTHPSLTTDGSRLHLFWMDNRDTTYNSSGAIYYKRKNWLGVTEIEANNSRQSGLILSCPTIARSSFHIKYDLGINKSGTVTLYDPTGRCINRRSVNSNSNNITIYINQDVSDGIYFLMLKVGIYHQIRKVVMMR